MASVPNPAIDTTADRRMVPRSELNLQITLRRIGDEAVIPAEISNLSATGFLAEVSGSVALLEHLQACLPNAGARMVQVVWISGTLAACNFTTPLTRADLSAAQLKSDFREQGATKAVPTFSIGPSDPIWGMLNEAAPSEKLPLRYRIALIGAAGVIPGLSLGAAAALLA